MKSREVEHDVWIKKMEADQPKVEENKEQAKGQAKGQQQQKGQKQAGGKEKKPAVAKPVVKLEDFPRPQFWDQRIAIWEKAKQQLSSASREGIQSANSFYFLT